MTAQARMTLRVLGGAQLTGEDTVATPLDRRSAALLTYLALEGPSTRARLAGLLYPDAGEATSRNNLVHLLRRLKRSANADLVTGDATLALAEDVAVDAGLALAGQDVWSAAGPGGSVLLDTLDYGDLPDFEDWLMAWRERLTDARRATLLARVGAFERTGDLEEALRTAQRLVDEDPISEDAWRRLMRLHYLRGDRPAALDAYHRCQAVLKREFGVEPLPETVQLARDIDRGALQSERRAAPTVPLTVLRPPVLVGRAREWALIDEAVTRGQLVLVLGEPGIGKSRLLQEYLAASGGGMYFECRPGDHGLLYGSNVRFLRQLLTTLPDLPMEPWVRRELTRLLPELELHGAGPPAPISNDEEKTRFYAAKAEILRSAIAAGTRLFVWDDTQYMDEGSLEALVTIWNGLGWGSPDAPMRILWASRPVEFSPESARALDLLADAAMAATVRLEALPLGAVEELLSAVQVEQLEGHAKALERFAGGNPHFLLETVRHLLETDALRGGFPERLGAPQKVGELISRRLARLSPTALHTARAAAVLRSDFHLELVAEVLGAPVLDVLATWEELEVAGVLRGERFNHDLVYETVLAGIPGAVRAMLHRSAARMFSRQAAAGQLPDAARVAWHWQEGGDAAAAATWWLRAAEAARAAFRPSEAASAYERAADLLIATGDHDGAFDALHVAVRLLVDVSYQQRLSVVARRLSDMARTPSQTARAYEAQLHYLFERGELHELERLARVALDFAAESGDGALESVIHEALATVGLLTGRLDLAREHLTRLKELTESSDDAARQATAEVGLGRVASVERRRDALDHFVRARELYVRANDRTGEVSALTKTGLVWLELGRADRARDLSVQADRVLRDLDQHSYSQLLNAHLALRSAQALGQYARALEVGTHAMTFDPRDQSWWRSVLRVDLALLYLTLGMRDLAERELAAARARGNLLPIHEPRARLAEAWALAARGEEADHLFMGALAHETTRASPFDRAELLVAYAVFARPDEGVALASEAETLARSLDLGGVLVAALTRRAQARLRTGYFTEALADAAEAADLLGSFTPALPEGEVLLTHADALTMNGRPEANRARDLAREWFSVALQGLDALDLRVQGLDAPGFGFPALGPRIVMEAPDGWEPNTTS